MNAPAITIHYPPGGGFDLPGHVFPMGKYEAVRKRLLELRSDLAHRMRPAPPASWEEVRLVHTEEYLRRAQELARTPELAYLEFEIPLSLEGIEFLRRHAGGSIQACRDAVATRRASVNLGGGFHHAFADHGEGFCFINDVAVAVRVLQKEARIRRAAVIDCDLHQGNGTARIFAGDASVFTFSIHQENNYPLKQRSDWDIGLEDFAGDDRYVGALEEAIPRILDEQGPDLVFYVGGADPYEDDLLGGLKLSKEGLRRRDRLVFGHCRRREIPVAAALAGGYASRFEDLVEIHANMVLDLVEIMEEGPSS